MKKSQNLLILLAATAAVFVVGCNNPQSNSVGSDHNPLTDKTVALCAPTRSLDVKQIEEITGMKGTEKNGEYKITVPQNDLKVVVDGFKITPPMGLGSWAAFTPCGDSAMVMGDIILAENDVKSVQREVIRQGFTITALHNHFVRNKPSVFFMHIGRTADVPTLAKGVKAIFEKIAEVRGADPGKALADSVVNTLDLSSLDKILGSKGEMSKGVYKYTIGRPDIQLTEHGAPVSTFMGFNTWAAWQGTPDHAAVAGDFAMLEDEVAPVIKTLIENGIEVVAVHNHMVHETPKIFFLHYWGTGNAVQLAKGLKAALDCTGKETK